MGLRVCPNCGESYVEIGQEKLQECSHCGFRFNSTNQPVPVPPVAEQVDTHIDTPVERKQEKAANRSTTAYIVIAIGIV